MGSGESPLTLAGERQARECVAQIVAWRPDRVLSSPSPRALAVAEPAADRLGGVVDVWSELAECDFGLAEGLTYAQMEARGLALRAYTGFEPPGSVLTGESERDVRERVSRAARRVVALGGRCAIVTHGGVMRILLEEWAGMAPQQAGEMALSNGATLEFASVGEGMTLVRGIAKRERDSLPGCHELPRARQSLKRDGGVSVDWNSLIREDLAGLSPYVPGLRVSQVRERSGRENVHKLSSNECPYGPVPRAIEAMNAVLPHLNRYSDGAISALRCKLSVRHGIPVEQIAVTNGSNELLRLVAQVVVRPGDEVVYPWPSFVVYPMLADIFGAVRVPVPLDTESRIDLDAILATITPRTRLVFLCNPNNPTGTIYSREAFSAFMDDLPDHVVLVIDEAYIEFVTDTAFPDGLQWFDGKRPVVVTRTFSKIYALAGLRIGYGFMPEPLVEALAKVREPFNVNTVAQIAAYYSLDDEQEVVRRRAENQEQKTYLYGCFDRLGLDYAPSQTNFVYFKTDRPVEVFEALLEEGVIVRDFGNQPALRVGIGTPEDTVATITAFESVAARLGAF